MTERRICEREEYLLDDDIENSSTSSDPEHTNWVVLTGIFIIQLVVSGVLASYGVLLVSLVEETEVSLREALWTPLTYIVSCCFADPLCKRLSDRKGGQGCRLLAITGILIVAGGIATTNLFYKSRLHVLSYGFLGGLGTSLVLTQAEIILHCHYPRHSSNSGPPLIMPQLGSALAHFSMPLLLLGIVSLYGLQETLLLQAGVVLQGFLGAVTLSPPTQRPSPISRYHSRPRAFTFVVSEDLPTARRDGYLNDSWTGRNSLTNITSGHSRRNCASCNVYLERTNCRNKQIARLEGKLRCKRNRIDVLPEIPEESEESSDSEISENHEETSAVYNDLKLTNNTLCYGARSMDSCLHTDEINVKLAENCVGNKRWSIGTVGELMPLCVENGLAKYKSISNHDSSSRSSKNTIMIINSDHEIKEEKSFCNTSESSVIELDSQVMRSTLNTLPVHSSIWFTKSLSGIDSKFSKTDISEFDSLRSKSIDNSNIFSNTDFTTKQVRSLDNILPVFGNVSLINQSDTLKEDVLISNINSVCMNSSDKIAKSKNEHVHDMKLPHENNCLQEQWNAGSFRQLLSTKVLSPSVDSQQGQSSSLYQKWHTTELRGGNHSMIHTDISENLLSNGPFTFEIPARRRNTNTNVTKSVEKCHEVIEVELSSLDSGEIVNPIWTARLMSSETLTVESASDSFHGSNYLRKWSQHHSSLLRGLRGLIMSCSCHTQKCHNLRRHLRNNFISLFWKIPECFRVPYFYPSLLLQLTLKLCPMGFTALSPLLATRTIDGCTNEEAVFTVSISGFVWMCFLLVTPWCSKILHCKHRYLFVAGNVISACGLHLLSKTKTHNSLTMSCAIFGLGLGTTMVTGKTVMRDALGTWNLAKVDILLDLLTGVLILIIGSVMDLILMNQEDIAGCFTLLAVIYLATGTSWLLGPLFTRLRCHHHTYSIWSSNGGHLLTSG